MKTFKITLEKMTVKDEPNVDLEVFTFETKRKANAFKKKLAKQYECVEHGYHLVNFKKMLEITSNY